MLDNIIWNNHPGQVVGIVWHIYSASPLYSAEANTRWRQYPPPYQGSYATPWLWVHGHNSGYTYPNWETYVSNALADTSDVQINMTANYDPGTRGGTIQAVFVNGRASAITANAYFVVTEDSCHYTGSNGQPVHNHVCRDYIPDQNGTQITIPATSADTVTQDYTLDAAWNELNCNLVVYLQDPTIQPDSSKLTYQAATIPVASLTGIAERRPAARVIGLTVGPNPTRGLLNLQLSPTGSKSGVAVSDAAGRLVKTVRTDLAGCATVDLRTAPEGVYFVCPTDNPKSARKVVVQH